MYIDTRIRHDDLDGLNPKITAKSFNGDFATYGREIAIVQQALERLGQLVPASAAP